MGSHKQNFNLLLIGQIGSGKSNFMRHLLSITPRAVVFDRMGEYETALSFDDFETGARFIAENIRKNWHVIVRSDSTETALAYFDFLMTAQMSDETLPPVAVFVDEASYFSDSHSVPREVEDLYTKGRHARVNTVTAVQRMTQINPIIRDQNHVWVSLYLNSLPPVMAQAFNREQVEQIKTLETYKPFGPPEYGRHFVTNAGERVDVLDRWVQYNPGG